MILLDLMMPEMDGFAVVAALQKEPGWRDIPVIVITSLDLSASGSRAAQFRRPIGVGEGDVPTGRAGRAHSPACARESRSAAADGSSIVIKVLYVEDNDDNVYMLKMRLELLRPISRFSWQRTARRAARWPPANGRTSS